MSATAQTPLQREAATTIFEKGAPGRRAFSCPAMDVPEVEGLLPEALHEQPVVREFAVRQDAPVKRVIDRCQDAGVNPGFALGREYDEHPDGLLVAVTERRTREHIDRLASVLGAAVAAEREAVTA